MDLLLPYAEYVVPVFWFGFVGYAIVAIIFYRHRFVRSSFVAVFFIGLIFFNTISPVVLLPYTNWHKFSSPRPDTLESTSMRLVDENGEEIRYPAKATLAFSAIQLGTLQEQIVQGRFSEKKTEEIARYLIVLAENYRDRVQNPSSLRYVRYPPHHPTPQGWLENEDYDAEFVGIRIYRTKTITSSDGREIVGREEELLVEIFPESVPSDQPVDKTNYSMSTQIAASTGGVH